MVIVYGNSFGNAPITRGCIQKAVVIKEAEFAEYVRDTIIDRVFLVVYKTAKGKEVLARFDMYEICGYEIREDKEEA